jgi:hypothetical protein
MKKETESPNYGSFDSYLLTGEQVKRAIEKLPFIYHLVEEGDEEVGILLALLRSFTFTTENLSRENMLNAAEEAMLPHIEAAHNVLMQLSIKGYESLTQEHLDVALEEFTEEHQEQEEATSEGLAHHLIAIMTSPETPVELHNTLADEILRLNESVNNALNPDVMRAVLPIALKKDKERDE